MNRTPEDIIKDCKKGKTGAQEAIYKMFAGKMFALCLRYSDNREDAGDNLHDGFIKVFESIRGYKFKGSFEGWLRRVFVTVCLAKYKKQIKQYNYEDFEIEDTQFEDEKLLDIPQDKLFEIINSLPHKYRLVFNMYVLDSYSHEEISKTLGISTGTSKSNLSRAKNILRNSIMEFIDNEGR